MVWILVLLILALLFGIGAVVEGLLWLFLITAVLVIAAVVFGARVFGQNRA